MSAEQPVQEHPPDVLNGTRNRERKDAIKDKLFGAHPADGPGPQDSAQQISSAATGTVASDASDCAPALPAGLVIGQYQIVRRLGRGGMGEVFLARDVRLERLVAIKLITDSDVATSERFRSEARTTAQCKHENIVVIHDIGELAGQPYMVLEYLEGITLRARLSEHPAPAPGEALQIVSQILRGLAHAHRQGLVHRDLKPENVMLTDDGGVKILDFGIAKVLTAHAPTLRDHDLDRGLYRTSVHQTRAGAVSGTLPYMSPEQMRAEEVDQRTDIWAVGVILWELLIGRHPLKPLTRERVVELTMSAAPMPSLRTYRPGLSRLADIVDRCLDKRKAERWPSAQALLDQLRAAASDPASAPKEADEERPAVSQPERQSEESVIEQSAVGHGPSSYPRPVHQPVDTRQPAHPARAPWLWLAAALALVGTVAVVAISWPPSDAPASRPEMAAEAEPLAGPAAGMARIAGAVATLGSTPADTAAAIDTCLRTLGDEPESFCDAHYFDRETPRANQRISDFDMAVAEVTHRQFTAWLNGLGVHPDAAQLVHDRDGTPLADLSAPGHGIVYRARSRRHEVDPEQADNPVIYVTWYGAHRYCQAHEMRLPTEEEWEFAARGISRQEYPWGNAAPTCAGVVIARDSRHRQHCNRDGRISRGPRAVSTGHQDVTPAGVRGLGGNVSEWTASRFVSTPTGQSPCLDSHPAPPGWQCTVRGGSWASPPVLARSATRMRASPAAARSDIGFRCVKEIVP